MAHGSGSALDALKEALHHSMEKVVHEISHTVHVRGVAPALGIAEVTVAVHHAIEHGRSGQTAEMRADIVEALNGSLNVATAGISGLIQAIIEVKVAIDRIDGVPWPTYTPQDLAIQLTYLPERLDKAIEHLRHEISDTSPQPTQTSGHNHERVDGLLWAPSLSADHAPQLVASPNAEHSVHQAHHPIPQSHDYGVSSAIEAVFHGPGTYHGLHGEDVGVLIGGHHYSIDLGHDSVIHVTPDFHHMNLMPDAGGHSPAYYDDHPFAVPLHVHHDQ